MDAQALRTERETLSEVRSVLGGVIFAAFIAGKVTGVLATWSWWWLLLPIVPVLAKIVGWA